MKRSARKRTMDAILSAGILIALDFFFLFLSHHKEGYGSSLDTFLTIQIVLTTTILVNLYIVYRHHNK